VVVGAEAAGTGRVTSPSIRSHFIVVPHVRVPLFDANVGPG